MYATKTLEKQKQNFALYSSTVLLLCAYYKNACKSKSKTLPTTGVQFCFCMYTTKTLGKAKAKLRPVLECSFAFYKNACINKSKTAPLQETMTFRLPPSAVQKECQQVIHFVAYNEVYHEGIKEPLSDEQKKEVMYCIVHEGNTRSVESMSLNQQFLAGARQFDQVFDKEVVRITDDGASNTKEILVLKDVLHRQQGVRFVVGQEITEKLIRSSTLKGTRVVESRTMKKMSKLP
jgi:hypothetical protein